MTTISELGQDLQCLTGVFAGDALVAECERGEFLHDIKHLEDDPMLAREDAGGADAREIHRKQMIGAGHGELSFYSG